MVTYPSVMEEPGNLEIENQNIAAWEWIEFIPSDHLHAQYDCSHHHCCQLCRRPQCLRDRADPRPVGAYPLGRVAGRFEILGNWVVIAVSGTLFAAEFVADKIPGLDMVWNALHTFIRVPVAGLLAYRASSHLSPEMQLLATLGGAAIAMVAHSSKTAVRAVVTPSPEPVSNIALSTGEDGIAIGLTWLVTQHPWTAASIAIALIVIAILMTHWVVRALRRTWTRLQTI